MACLRALAEMNFMTADRLPGSTRVSPDRALIADG
jgi:hypothetical protein